MPFRPAQLLPPKRWQRVLLFGGVGLLLLVGAAWLAVPRFLEPTIRRKLQAMVSSRVDARLDLGGLTYLPPYGVRIRNATLVAPDPAGGGDVQVLQIDTLVLRLARPPWTEGPLVIKSLEVTKPAVHLIQSPDGIIGVHRFVRDQPATQPADDDPLDGKRKLSDMFELRHFVIKDGQVVYIDRGRPGTVPMVWKGFAVDLKTGPASKSLYEYQFDASHGELAKLSSAGSFDLDSLHLDARTLTLGVVVKSDDATSPLPAALQRVLRENHVNGRLTVNAKATVPLKDISSASAEADFNLEEASARSPHVEDFPLDRLSLKLHAEMKPVSAAPASRPATLPSPATKPAAPSVFVRLDAFDAASAGRSVRLDKAELRIDPAANVWRLSEFAGKADFGKPGPVPPPAPADSAEDRASDGPASRPSGPLLDRLALAGEVTFTVAAEGPVEPPAGRSMREAMKVEAVAYPRGLRVRPPKFPHPLTDVGGGGSVALRGDVIVCQDLTGRYGNDELRLEGVRLRVPTDLSDFRRKGYRFEEIEGAVTFHPPRQAYPKKLEKTFRRLNPVGTFLVGGGSWFEVARVRPDPDITPPSDGWWKSSYFFDIAADGAANFYLTGRRIPVERMRGYATVSNLLIDIPRLEADLFGGRAVGSGNITPGKPWIYQGQARLRDADLKEAGRFFLPPEKRSDKLSGKAGLNIQFAGTMTADQQGDNRPKDTLRATGEFEVLEGDFWSLPGLAEVAAHVRKRDPLTVGEAAGLFDVSEREVRLRRAAIASPALGLLGSGTIGFDNTMDLQLVAAPLGDWRDRMKQAKVPIVSDVAAEVVGGVQKLINSAAGTLLYEFRVSGKVSKPDVKVVPAPVLSDPAALLFGQMVNPKKDRRLIESVRDDNRSRR